MSQDKIDLVYSLLKNTEPQTPSQIAEKANLKQRAVQTILLELVTTNDDVKMKKIGRYRLFWRIK